MSKYEELCNAFDKAKNDYSEYRKDCHNFAVKLVKSFCDYLEAPEGRVQYVPSDMIGFEKEKREYNLDEVMSLDDEAFWSFGLKIFLTSTDPSLQRSIVIHFFVKKNGDDFLVKIDEDDRGHVIKEPSEDDFLKFNEFYCEHIKNLIKSTFENFIQGKSSLEKIGFIL